MIIRMQIVFELKKKEENKEVILKQSEQLSEGPRMRQICVFRQMDLPKFDCLQGTDA